MKNKIIKVAEITKFDLYVVIAWGLIYSFVLLGMIFNKSWAEIGMKLLIFGWFSYTICGNTFSAIYTLKMLKDLNEKDDPPKLE